MDSKSDDIVLREWHAASEKFRKLFMISAMEKETVLLRLGIKLVEGRIEGIVKIQTDAEIPVA